MRKLLGRLLEGIARGIVGFVLSSIFWKLLLKSDDWLFYSLTLSIPDVFATLILYYTIVDMKNKKWPVTIGTTLFVFIGSLFVLGVCLSVEKYFWKIFMITFSSFWAMCTIKVDEALDSKRTTKKTEEKVHREIVV